MKTKQKPTLVIETYPTASDDSSLGETTFESFLSLTDFELEELKQDKENKVQMELEQAITLLNAPNFLEKKFYERKFKPEVLALVLKHIKAYPKIFTQEIFDAVKEEFLKRNIGEVKSRPVKFHAPKQEGITTGRFVRKVPKDSTPSVKYKLIWLEKVGGVTKRNIGEEICEYIGSNLMKQIMQNNSPKVRLYKTPEGEVRLMSKFIDGFAAANTENSIDIISRKFRNSVNKEEFFLANILCGDYDTNFGNVGFRKEEGNIYLVRIDNGKALSYKKIKAPIYNSFEELYTAPLTLTSEELLSTVRSRVFRDAIYKFEGEEFHLRLFSICENLDMRALRSIITFSLNNVEDAYGKDILETPDVDIELRERIELPDGPISKEILIDTIMSNIEGLRVLIQGNALALEEIDMVSESLDSTKTQKSGRTSTKRKFQEIIEGRENRPINR